MLKQLPKPLNYFYAEGSQKNPLRWCIYAKEEDGRFLPQTGVIQCKDFFNEVVGWYYGHKTRIYGFDTTGAFHVNEEGVYLRLYHCSSKLWENIEKVIQPLLREQVGCELELLDKEDSNLFIFFPRKLWDNTYLISKLTLMIRASNFPQEINSYEELQKMPEIYINKCSSSLKLESPFSEYWWYGSPSCNAKTTPSQQAISVIHSNGFIGWEHGMKQGVPNAI